MFLFFLFFLFPVHYSFLALPLLMATLNEHEMMISGFCP